jgi:RluA family pseudouridine synthase
VFSVSAEAANKRLDALVREFGGLSQKKARLLCKLGGVAVDGVCAPPTARIREGSHVSFATEYIEAMLQIGLPIAFLDDDVMVLAKPPGLAVHAGPLVETSVADAVEPHYPKIGLAHRLDREASGLLLMGLSPESLATLGRAMERNEISREYEAIVHGALELEEQTIDLPLRVTDEPHGRKPKTIVDPDGLKSVSRVKVLSRRQDATHVRVTIDTGRTHQIRAHLHAIGHPLLGDPRYGDETANEHARATYGVHRTLLHAKQLRFAQPTTKGTITVTASDEPDFARIFPRRRS